MDYNVCKNAIKKKLNIDVEFAENAVVINNQTYELMPTRFSRRLKAMRTLCESGTLGTVCSYKSVTVEHKCKSLKRIVMCALDECEWLLDDKINSIYSVTNGRNTSYCIVTTSKGYTGAIDVSTTLSSDTAPITRHEITGVEGMITDRSINEQIPVEAVYMFNSNQKIPETFTDVDMYMYGLNPEEVMVCDNISELVLNEASCKFFKNQYDRLEYLFECAEKSARTGDKITTEVK